MYFVIILLFFLVIIVIVYMYVDLIDVYYEEVCYFIMVFDNICVLFIELLFEIVIEGNVYECYKILMLCFIYGDCDLCCEGLVNC